MKKCNHGIRTVDLSKYKNSCMACEMEAMKKLIHDIDILNTDPAISKRLREYFGMKELGIIDELKLKKAIQALLSTPPRKKFVRFDD